MPDQGTNALPTLSDPLPGKAGVGLCLVAPDGTVLRASAEWLRSTGFTEEQVVGENIIELFPATRDMALALHARARAGHRVEVSRHAQVIGGRETWWEGSIEPVPMESGTGLLIAAREVTGRLHSDEVLSESEHRSVACCEQGRSGIEHEQASLQRFYAVLSSMYSAILLVTNEGRVEFANPAFCSRFGVKDSPADLVGLGSRDMIEKIKNAYLYPEDAVRRIREILDRGQPVMGEEVAMRDGGVCLRDFLPLNVNGQTCGRLWTHFDITERKRAETALRHSTFFLTEAQRIAHFGSWEWDIGSGTHAWSDETFRILGHKPGAFVPSHDRFLALVHPEDRPNVARAIESALHGKEEYDLDFRVLPSGNSVRWIHSCGEIVFDADGQALRMIGVALDITERKQAEEALHESERLLADVLDGSPMPVFLKDLDGRFLTVNKRLEGLLGVPREQLKGKTDYDIISKEQADTYREHDRKVIESKHPILVEETAQLIDGRHVYLNSKFPLIDSAGRVYGVGAISHDITERKRAEEALRDADRRKDEFLGMLSHELRNPLAPIRNSTYILRHAAPASEQARRAQTVIERQAEHMTRLVDDLLDVTRIARGKIELRRDRVDVGELVRRTAEDFRAMTEEKGVALQVEMPHERLWAHVDAVRVAQVIGNLLHNSAKFTHREGKVVVSAQTRQGRIEIAVRDTGAGIAPELLPHLFEAFVQGELPLARSEGGLGLGLALVKGIAELHGGSVEAHSAGKGQGSEFVVRLPLAEVVAAQEAASGRVQRRSGERRVLVVDDNRDAAESLADIISMMGHAVEVAYDGPTAIQRARASAPDVVLCDVGLPGMSGYEVAKALRASALEGVQLFAVSGYAQPEDVKDAIEAGFDGHVAKPCDPGEIERLLS